MLEWLVHIGLTAAAALPPDAAVHQSFGDGHGCDFGDCNGCGTDDGSSLAKADFRVRMRGLSVCGDCLA
jgi:hypothetical protein